MSATMLDLELDLLDFPVDDPACENPECRHDFGPVRFRTWFEPICPCGVMLVCAPCAADLRAVMHAAAPFKCRDCDETYLRGTVRDYLRITPLSR